ncbi:PucR family transcriptional regulator [Nocardia huaxiensis]|uniref:Helix-turn-helix domain-containing protein n=1 Tax=Nocardia huaxiensis TaxID=2755382 RepID=A0A7D6ZB77_9NOCA|nr:helix-turn-helix domain-containing protein [Nocardia huaxiensis]QLY31408.1 helix-turn-helix domain-containing protein [Nocardia huaxiensis]UFS94957.1 helix-turn-helix domain-containing protein [Nocardia huaxiensis]
MTTAANTTVVRQWIADFVAETLRTDSLEEVVARLDNAIVARVPELADRDMRRDLAASTRAHALEMLAGLNQEHMSYPVPEEAHAFARTIARRGHDLRVLLRIYNVGQEAVLDYMTEVINQRQLPQEVERAVLLRLFDRSIRWVGTSVEALTGTYTEERERGLRAALTRRSEIVRALLDGGELEIEEASARLGYRLSGRHLALVLWTDEDPDWAKGSAPRPDGDVADMLERVVARCATAFGDGVLTVSSGASSLWAWIAVSDDTALPPVGDWPVEAPVRLTVGIPAAGILGFRRSHREAVAARQVAERAQPNSPRVLHYPEVEVAYLAGADEAAMRALVERELGALADPGPQAARLRETLHAYLRANRSPDAAAKTLGVHKNTVRYRIQRIEELLGHSLDQRGARLEIALDCVAAYGV